MKYLSFKFILSAFFLVLASCGGAEGPGFKQQRKQAPGLYSIKGHLTGLDADSAWIYFCHSDRPRMDVQYDSALVLNGRFAFSGKSTEAGPFLFAIASRERDGKVTRSRVFHGPFILDEGNLVIEGRADSLNNIRAAGTAGQDAYNSFKSLVKPLIESQNSLYRQRNSTKASDIERLYSLDKALDSVDLQMSVRVSDHVSRHPSSVVSAYIVNSRLRNAPAAILKPIYSKLSEQAANSRYGKAIAASIQAGERTAVGRKALDFQLPDIKGKLVSLANYNAKYLLVDFWASWCGPCRAEHPNFRKIYRKYKDFGFEHVSISMDTDRKAWVRAIKEDELEWTQLLDSNANSDVKRAYGIQQLPMNFLLDGEGKIIATNLSSIQLYKKLTELCRQIRVNGASRYQRR